MVGSSSLLEGGTVFSASLPKPVELSIVPSVSRISLLPLFQRESPIQILAELNQKPFFYWRVSHPRRLRVLVLLVFIWLFQALLFPILPLFFSGRALLGPKPCLVAHLVLKAISLFLRLQAQLFTLMKFRLMGW